MPSAPTPVRTLDPAAVDVWLFDLDNTLYPSECNLFAQIDAKMMAYIQDLLGLDAEGARALKRRYFHEHGTTMNGLMHNHGIEPAAFLHFVHDIDVSPVPHCAELDAALARLPGRKIVFTNGSVAHAERVMARRGIAHHFEDIFDIVASGYRPKPDAGTYDAVCRRFGVVPARAAMVDDIPRNLEPAHALGMTTVWVRSTHHWSALGEPGAHIHHTVDDLVVWLTGLTPAEAAEALAASS